MTYLDPPEGYPHDLYDAAADWFEEPVEYVTDSLVRRYLIERREAEAEAKWEAKRGQ